MRFTPEPNSNMPSIASKLMPRKGLAPTIPNQTISLANQRNEISAKLGL
jgi:hypothetical protein